MPSNFNNYNKKSKKISKSAIFVGMDIFKGYVQEFTPLKNENTFR